MISKEFFLSLCAISGVSQATVINIPAIHTGNYSRLGAHDSSNPNYLTGAVNGVNYAGYVVFDVSSLARPTVTESSTETRVTATRVYRDSSTSTAGDPLLPGGGDRVYGYRSETYEVTTTVTTSLVTSGDDISRAWLSFGEAGLTSSVSFEDLEVFDVTTPLNELLGDSSSDVAIYSDLSTGDEYSGRRFLSSSPSLESIVQLDEFLDYLFSGGVALGLTLDSPSSTEYVFGQSGLSPEDVTLRLNIEDTAQSVTRVYSANLISTDAFVSSESSLVSEPRILKLAGVPEPSSLLLMSLGVLLSISRRIR